MDYITWQIYHDDENEQNNSGDNARCQISKLMLGPSQDRASLKSLRARLAGAEKKLRGLELENEALEQKLERVRDKRHE